MAQSPPDSDRDRALERVFLVASPLVLVVAWEISARTGWLDRRIFSSPATVVALAMDALRTGELWRDTSATLARFAAGMLVGIVPAVLLGLTMGIFRPVRAAITPLVWLINPLPRVALFPLVLITVGLNETSNILMIAMGPFFSMLISTMAGVLNVEPIYLRVARSFNVRTFDLYFKVVFPAALPIIFSGLQVSLALGLLGVVTVEFLTASNGLGYLIWHSWQVLSLGLSMVGLITAGLLGFLLYVGLDWLEKRLIPWASRS
jgi:ABC-type nitrate/sulfonate/bicarbonate transport system permease component